MSKNNNNLPGQHFELYEVVPSKEFPERALTFTSAKRIKTESYLDSNVSDDAIRVALLYIQDLIIERVLGTCLTDQLRELICSGQISDNRYRYYKELLDSYLYPIFSYGVQAELPIPLGFKNRNQGMVQPQGDSFEQTALADIQYISKFYRNRMDFYMKRAMDFVLCNRHHFRELCCCGGGCCNCTQQPFNQDYDTGIFIEPTNREVLRSRRFTGKRGKYGY